MVISGIHCTNKRVTFTIVGILDWLRLAQIYSMYDFKLNNNMFTVDVILSLIDLKIDNLLT